MKELTQRLLEGETPVYLVWTYDEEAELIAADGACGPFRCRVAAESGGYDQSIVAAIYKSEGEDGDALWEKHFTIDGGEEGDEDYDAYYRMFETLQNDGFNEVFAELGGTASLSELLAQSGLSLDQ